MPCAGPASNSFGNQFNNFSINDTYIDKIFTFKIFGITEKVAKLQNSILFRQILLFLPQIWPKNVFLGALRKNKSKYQFLQKIWPIKLKCHQINCF